MKSNKLQSLTRLEKHHWIAELVNGKSYADIGGLWGTINETISIASMSGATECTMVDIQHSDSKWWKAFHRRCEELGIHGYNTIVADACDPSQLDVVGKFDIVHCSGILYHVSDPIAFVRNIASLAHEYFIIGSMLIPEKIENENGVLETLPGTLRCVPLLGEWERKVLAHYFDGLDIKVGGVNKARPEFVNLYTGRVRTGPWWYLFTSETLQEMCRLCGAEILKVSETKQGAANVLCKKTPG